MRWREQGFTLIELMVVVVIIAVVWVAALPYVQPDQQRQGRDWLRQAEAFMALSCDLSAQTMHSHRVLWQEDRLLMQVWRGADWQAVSDVESLVLVAGWSLRWAVNGQWMGKQKLEPSWLCRPDGDQTAGALQLQRSGLGELSLTWQGDGRYVQTTRL